MKKIFEILAAAIATSVFTVDISARLIQKGSLAGGVQDGDTYSFGVVNIDTEEDAKMGWYIPFIASISL